MTRPEMSDPDGSRAVIRDLVDLHEYFDELDAAGLIGLEDARELLAMLQEGLADLEPLSGAPGPRLGPVISGP